ncbi:hypothetical protein [Halodesulfovibrio sp.]|jgi:hypothetical protein|uniref:hypothetical protein n=1 Tax=Halodesulfovibrio sp. TaxID=1912772 RepID=UPI0025EE0C34|nr:hypothetical protein [Halodesulfovibrio sp.]MCT4625841.1 hypothetical protein [Halodesulfovibrio sp.]
MTPDEAREELCLFFKPEWHSYINTKLAGDFAGELAVIIREHNKMQTDMALAAEFEVLANARIAELTAARESNERL